MIAFAADVLIFELSNGDHVPYSAEMISVELMGETADLFDEDFVRHASKAVFHYFRVELERRCVPLSEFADALEKVLRGLALHPAPKPPVHTVLETDLCQIACETGKGCELFFFPRLRQEIQNCLRQAPLVLKFHGLRSCVKQLLGVRRWTPQCQVLEEQIVEYLRRCASGSSSLAEFALLVK